MNITLKSLIIKQLRNAIARNNAGSNLLLRAIGFGRF
jgi:hypothetical protein